MKKILKYQNIVIASHNNGKVRELKNLFSKFSTKIIPVKKLGLSEPKETGKTFEENAKIKSSEATRLSNLPAIGDDSGLAISALKGKPGIYSARWSGPDRNFTLAFDKIFQNLSKEKKHKAEFICAIALSQPTANGFRTKTYVGKINGNISWPPKGDKGFGYDPIFTPYGYKITFGEMNPNLKDRISHRAIAFKKLLNAFYI